LDAGGLVGREPEGVRDEAVAGRRTVQLGIGLRWAGDADGRNEKRQDGGARAAPAPLAQPEKSCHVVHGSEIEGPPPAVVSRHASGLSLHASRVANLGALHLAHERDRSRARRASPISRPGAGSTSGSTPLTPFRATCEVVLCRGRSGREEPARAGSNRAGRRTRALHRRPSWRTGASDRGASSFNRPTLLSPGVGLHY
jgi:hypothetical protein